MSKETKAFRFFLAIIAIILIAGITMVITGNTQQNHYAYLSSRKEAERDTLLNRIAETYMDSGVGDPLKGAVEQYIQRFPEDTRKDNNIVLLDESGTIVYQYNDQYLRADATKLSLYFDHWYGAIVYSPDQYDVFSAYGGFSFGEAGYFGDGTMTMDTAEKLRETLRAWSVDGNDTRNKMYVIEGTVQSKKFLLLWLYDDKVLSSLYSATNQEYPWRLWSGVINAGAIMILAYWLLLPVWVFLDARRRKTQPLPWALLVLVTNIVGMIVYWIVQNQNSKAPAIAGPACPACGKAVQTEFPYCPWCATPLHKNCAACGKPMEQEWVACPWCGKPSE